MRTSSTLLVLGVLGAIACTDHQSTSITAPSSGATLNRFAADLPLKGSCTTTFNPAPFPLPAIHHQIDTGTCHLTLLGLTDFYGEQDINFAAGTTTGQRTLTAANGDELYLTHTGINAPAGPGQITFTASVTIQGGTGRFAGATGSAQVTGIATLSTRSAAFTYDGSISLH